MADNNLKMIGQWLVGRKLADGTFSKIYASENVRTKQKAVLKIEPMEGANRDGHPLLPEELKMIQSLGRFRGLPELYAYSPNTGTGSLAIIMEKLGPSLEILFEACKRKFTLKTTTQLAVQMLNLIEHVHKKNIVYCDIKPENFLLADQTSQEINGGYGKNLLYIIDFGLSRKFIDSDGKHIPINKKSNIIGTLRYASISTHSGFGNSRRDDLEALMYVWMYFFHGKLPWQGLDPVPGMSPKDALARIADVKQNTPVEVICEGCPEEYHSFLRYVKGLRYDDQPNYSYLRKLLTTVYDTLMCDNEYDWKDINLVA